MGIAYVPELSASMSVSDMDAASSWYQKLLGFNLLVCDDDIAWCELSTGVPGVTVGLAQSENVAQGGGATNVWGVKDIEEAKAQLDAHRVKQDGDIKIVPDMVKLITFYDPDGNAMMFAQSLAKGR